MPELDLTSCDTEPIHRPGLIQPHGALLVLRRDDLTICQASANVEQVLGIALERLLGAPVEQIFAADEQAATYRQLFSEGLLETKPVYLFTVKAGRDARRFDAIAHRSGALVLLELEPTSHDRDPAVRDLYRLVQSAVDQVRDIQRLDALYDAAVKHIRRITGFDRVMLYRFDPDWNGQVVAEERRDDLEPFLHLHYPASDIPKQARELYTRNLLRFIPDRDYVSSPVLPAGPEPLDMSYSVLRSVSPIHLQYLRNMGVAASMSVSVIKQGKLWGLVACHHYSPRYVPYDVRTACELLAHVLAPHLTAAEERETEAYVTRLHDMRETLLRRMERLEDLPKALIYQSPNLLDFVHADGAAIVHGQDVVRVGQTPSEEQIRAIAQWAQTHAPQDIFATDHLSQHFGGNLLASVAAGVLVVRLAQREVHQLLWFRPEYMRTVHWAGDPEKSVVKGDGVARLSPRGSFALWKQIVRGRSQPWSNPELRAAALLRYDVMSLLIHRTETLAASNADLRLASTEREKLLDSERSARSEAEKLNRIKDEFVATLSHELRTPLNAILGWTQIINREQGLPEEVVEGLEIIERNALAQSQMIDDLLEMSRIISGKLRLDLQDTHLPTIVRAAVDTVRPAAHAKQVRIEQLLDPLHNVQTTGDPSRLQQVVWNLLSNAVKFTPRGGRVQIVLQRVESHVELSVADTGIGIRTEFLPYVFDRFRQADPSSSRKHGGLGLGLSIVRNLVELHGGTVRAESRGEGHGSTFIVSLPVRILAADSVGPRIHPRGGGRPPDCEALNLKGVRVLVVDDELDSRVLIERLLGECECAVSSAATVQEALELLMRRAFDVIISDIGMPGDDGYTLIRTWRALEEREQRPRIPAIALTAYARTEDRRRAILAGFQVHIAKPVESGELLAMVASLAGRV
jgi:light-regulated signal transduction histidine kinase (bacteriophytochrome)/ActR/RegA family two-component response regulator